METYKISQIAKLLGLSSDTIRFYEKKGLVHPSVNPDNQYREYDLDNILELLDIIYYRHLDISLQDIQSICTSRSRENMYELLLKKKQETEEKIRYAASEKTHLHIRDVSKSGIQSEHLQYQSLSGICHSV